MAARIFGGFAAAAALALLAIPATAQHFSDTFTFLKAVKERDGETASKLIDTPGSGSIVINARESSTGNSALHILARERDVTWLTFLLAKGARANVQNNEGNTPLAFAVQIGWAEGADRLLARGAAVDLANNRGETPLIMAVHNRDIAMVRLLLQRGADPRRTDSAAGYSALDYARQDNRSAAIAKLLETPKAAHKEVQGPTM